jgi:hypothetical protein
MVPIRSCIACRSRESSEALLHLVERNGQVTPDPEQKLGGRGAWLHPECFELASQRRSFDRAFKVSNQLSVEVLANFLNYSLNNCNSFKNKEQK